MSRQKIVLLLLTLTGFMNTAFAVEEPVVEKLAVETQAAETPAAGSPMATPEKAVPASDSPAAGTVSNSATTNIGTSSDTIYPLVSYKCNPEDDIITLTNSLLKGEEGANYEYSDQDGTYSPWNLVEIDRRPDRTHIVRTKKIVKQCVLSSGEYTITLEPHVFSRNLEGNCGATISSAFTVSFDDYEIKERTPFEDYCRGNSPIITRVTVFGKTGEVKIKRIPRYKFY